MDKLNFKTKKKILELFPELRGWFLPFIPLERFDEYIFYNYVEVTENYIDWTAEIIKEYKVKQIRCGLVIYTPVLCYLLHFIKPNEIVRDGFICCDLSGVEVYGGNTVTDGTYDKESFNCVMEAIMNHIGIRKKEDLTKHLVSLDLIDFDDLENARLKNLEKLLK